jgi:Ca2+/H+ antiporter
METGLIHTHSLLRWIALIAIVIAIWNAYTGMSRKRTFTANDNRWSLLTLIFFHIQLVVGLALYFIQGWHLQVGEMANKVIRFYSVEHLLAMILAIALVTIGRISAKRKAADHKKHKVTLSYYMIGLVIVLLSIPWPFREVGAGRSWFPGL